MADEYDKTRCFGKSEGLGKRLAMWANSLGRNRDYPWLGLGIVDDLKAAARELGVDPESLYPNEIFTHRVVTPQIWATEAPAWDAPEPAKVEYDL